MKISETLYEKSKKYLIGGGTAGGRFNAAIGRPLYIKRAAGARVYDVDGNEFIDYHTGSGSAMFGHAHPRIEEAIETWIGMGCFVNFETEYHQQLAELICDTIPSGEKVRLGNSGTEVTQGAIRIARSYTNRDLIVKFEGHFHGMHEQIWFNHNNAGTMDEHGEIESMADSDGFPEVFGSVVKNVPYNDIPALERVVSKYKGRIAAIILEPISFNCGCYPARAGYLDEVRAICDREGIVLIFDEVITGLRLRPGSAQAYYGVTPDLTTLAKAIGGGLPIAAIAGKSEIMKVLNPGGRTVMSGTYTGSLLPVLGSIECLRMSREPGFYNHIESIGEALYAGIDELFEKHGLPGHVRGMGARFGIYFGVEDPEDDYNWRTVAESYDAQMSKRFVKNCIENGLFFHDVGGNAPPHYGFSTQHTVEDIEITLDRLDKVFASLG